MASVQADSHAGLVVYERDRVAKVLEGAAEYIAACCHVLEQRDDSGGLFVSAVDVAGQVRDGLAFVTIRRVCHARMEIVELDAELLAALEVIHEGIVGLLSACWVGMCKIDQVGAVRYDMFVLVVRVVFTVGVESVHGFIKYRRVYPFALRFEE